MGDHHTNPIAVERYKPRDGYIVSRVFQFASGNVVSEPLQLFTEEADARAFISRRTEEWQRHHEALTAALSVMGVVAVAHRYYSTSMVLGPGLIGATSMAEATELARG